MVNLLLNLFEEYLFVGEIFSIKYFRIYFVYLECVLLKGRVYIK